MHITDHDTVTLGFFFFKQKTAYDMLRSLVGSEMCIRDRPEGLAAYLESKTINLPAGTEPKLAY